MQQRNEKNKFNFAFIFPSILQTVKHFEIIKILEAKKQKQSDNSLSIKQNTLFISKHHMLKV